MSATAREVQALILERERVGTIEHGATCDRTDLRAIDWLNHFTPELLDGAMYATALKRELPLMLRAAFEEGRRVAHSSECPELAFDTLRHRLIGGGA